MSAIFHFRIGHSSSRPIRPDQHVTHIVIAGEDSAAGRRDAEALAIAWAHLGGPEHDRLAHRGRSSEMPTSAELIGAEL